MIWKSIVWTSAALLMLACPGKAPEDEVPARIAVGGRVTNYQGLPIEGYRTLIIAADGERFESVTDPQGAFSEQDVLPPYAVTVVPTGALGGFKTALTFDGLQRTDPTLVLHASGTEPACSNRDTVTIEGTLPGALPAGHTARVIYAGREISPVYLEGRREVTLSEGATSFVLEIPFKTIPCVSSMRGELLVFGFDALGHSTGSWRQAVTLTGLSDTVAVVVGALELGRGAGVVSGRVVFPAGVPQVDVLLHMRVRENYVRFARVPVPASSGTFTFVVPSVDGVELLLEVTDGTTTFAYQRDVTPGTPVEITLPQHVPPVSPLGMADSSVPTFVHGAREGANAYMTVVTKDGKNIWTGISTTPSITMPELPGAAALSTTAEQAWVSTYALTLAPGVTLDQLLDGRLVRELAYHDWRFAPELVSSGSRGPTTRFFVP